MLCNVSSESIHPPTSWGMLSYRTPSMDVLILSVPQMRWERVDSPEEKLTPSGCTQGDLWMRHAYTGFTEIVLGLICMFQMRGGEARGLRENSHGGYGKSRKPQNELLLPCISSLWGVIFDISARSGPHTGKYSFHPHFQTEVRIWN